MESLVLMKELGMKTAVKSVEDKLEKQRKLSMAYNNFKFIPSGAVDIFNKKLREKTEVIYDRDKKKILKKIDPRRYNEIVYDKLVFCKLEAYSSVPPMNVLQEVKKAKDIGCFDSFEVAKIESVKEIIDPIIFGKVNGCSDLFFISQWDEDVKFEDLQKEAGYEPV